MSKLPPQKKALDVTNPKDLVQKVTDVEVVGDPDTWVLIAKASSKSQGWMKSTKAMSLGVIGTLIQVSTQQRNPDGSWALAEALTFVPNTTIVIDGSGKVAPYVTTQS